ncbi:hypothetical protein [Streptacidiphilus cavernicola]|uniref:PGM1 C-terminal domain-containing protein n=1 Tax=Streptacidiphilus cavernicola TaxID=3342716 RepID=A0ABV6VS06_9ACTN
MDERAECLRLAEQEQADRGAQAASLALIDVLSDLGIEITSVRTTGSDDGVRLGTVATSHVWTLCEILSGEVSRRAAAASLRAALSEVGARCEQ